MIHQSGSASINEVVLFSWMHKPAQRLPYGELILLLALENIFVVILG
jgi:hypothetical protein